MNQSKSRSGCGGTGARSLRIGRRILRVEFAPQRLVEVDVLLEGQRGIENLLHCLESVGLDVALDLACVAGGVLDDLGVALFLATAEQHIVLGKVRMPEHVGGHEHVVRETVARGEVRTTRIAGEHDLEQARIAHVPLQQLVDVARAERPVRHAYRQSVHGDFRHEAVGNGLEDDRRPVESEFAGQVFELWDVSAPIAFHGSAPVGSDCAAACHSVVKKWRTAPETSSGPAIE